MCSKFRRSASNRLLVQDATDEMIDPFLQLFKAYNPEALAQRLVEVGAGYSYAQVKRTHE
jgi:hypothetical protein